jgi:hypothetical protein
VLGSPLVGTGQLESDTERPQPPPLLALSCLIRAPCWANAPRWGGRQALLACACAPPSARSLLGPACGAGRHPSSLPFCLGPHLVNAVSLRKQSGFLTRSTELPVYRCPSTCFSTSAGAWIAQPETQAAPPPAPAELLWGRCGHPLPPPARACRDALTDVQISGLCSL